MPNRIKHFTTKDGLTDLYWNQELSLAQISQQLNCANVQYWFEKYGIPRRVRSCYHKYEFSRDLLFDLHWAKKLSIPKICKRLHVDDDTLKYHFKKLGVPFWKGKRQTEPLLSKEGLIMLYELREMTIKEIAELFQVGTHRVSNWLDFYQIQRRDHRLARVDKQMGLTKRRRWRTDRAHREKVMAANFAARAIKPNKAEQRLLDILQRHSLPFEYVGDGEVVISGLVPDFINVNGKKKIIELFGDFWHGERATRPTQTEHGRGAIFKKFGYRTLVIWQHELGDEDAVVAKVKAFQGVK